VREGVGEGPIRTAKSLIEQGRLSEALDTLRAALAGRPDAPGLIRLYAPLAVTHGRPDEARDAVVAFAERLPESPAWLRIFNNLVERDRSMAREAALRLFDRFGDDPDIACLACEALLETRGQQDAAMAACRRGLSGPDLNLSTIRLVRQLLQLGGHEEAAAWSDRMKTQAAKATPALQAKFRTLLRNQLWDAAGGAVQIHHGPAGSDTVLFVFCGLQNQPGVTSERFAALLKGLPVHWVLLRDPLMLMYLKGIPELGPDLPATAQALRRLADDLGASRRLCFGNSAGGYAAMRYGHAMDADGVLGLVAPTHGTEESMQKDGRAAAVVERLLGEVRHEVLDMRELLLARKTPLPTHLYFGNGMPKDAGFARHLDGVPGVTLHPVDFDQHGLMKHLVANGAARTMLADFILDALPGGPDVAR
jgi:hypothetical protein